MLYRVKVEIEIVVCLEDNEEPCDDYVQHHVIEELENKNLSPEELTITPVASVDSLPPGWADRVPYNVVETTCEAFFQ